MQRATTAVMGLGLLGASVLWWGSGRPERGAVELPEVTAAAASGRLVVDLVDGTDEAVLDELSARLGAPLSWVDARAEDEALAAADVPDLLAAIALLEDDPRVEVAEPSVQMTALGYPDDPLYEHQWHLRAMGAPAGWEQTPRGKGVVVAVIDSGVSAVEDLDPARLLPGASFVPGTDSAADDNGHGTHVAGTIAQTTNNGIGVAGVAPEATILPVKVLSAFGSGSSEAIAAGIDYAVDEGADVINLSLGGGYSAVIHTAVRKARAEGVLVIAAAGNSGRRGVSWPGALPEAIGVSATGPDGDLAPYSSWGPGVDIAAPGGDKRVTNGGVLQDTIAPSGHAYTELQGTSMAAPHVAGAAAVLLSTGDCSVDCVEELLLRTARGAGLTEQRGHGDLDLARALSQTTDRWPMVRFALGLLAGALVGLGAGAKRGFVLVAALTGALAAGGLFFLDGLVGSRWAQLFSDGVLTWPGALLGSWASRVPLTYSALLPVVVALPLAGSRRLRPVAAGLAAGVAVSLVHAAAFETVQPWLMGRSTAALWLVGNAVVAGLLALSLAGQHTLEESA